MQWMREMGFLGQDSLDDTAALKEGEEEEEGLLFVPAFGGLLAPHWDPHRTASMRGLTLSTRPQQVVRAGLWGLAMLVADVVEALGEGGEVTMLRCDGGLSKSDQVLKRVSEATRLPVVRGDSEATALGAAYAAYLACHTDLPPAAPRTEWQHSPRLSEEQWRRRRDKWIQEIARK